MLESAAHAAARGARALARLETVASDRTRRRRRLFVTTKTLEKAIAAEATIGLSSPATASGMAATL